MWGRIIPQSANPALFIIFGRDRLVEGGFSYLGRHETTNPIVEIIRAIPRPAVTIMFAAVITQKVSEGVTPEPWFLAFAIPIITWWFGEKFWAHKKERDNGM